MPAEAALIGGADSVTAWQWSGAGSACIDRGENHVETTIHLPGGLRLHTEGWSAADIYDVDGDPRAIARALGITPEVLAEEHIVRA